MKKIIIAMLLLSAVLFASCSSEQTQVQETVQTTEVETTQVETQTETQTQTNTEVETTQTTQTATSDDEVLELTVEGFSFGYSEDVITVAAGQKVRITFVNTGGTHDFVIEGTEFRTPIIKGGDSSVLEFTIDEAGEYSFYCSVGSHRAAGMEGTLIVQ